MFREKVGNITFLLGELSDSSNKIENEEITSVIDSKLKELFNIIASKEDKEAYAKACLEVVDDWIKFEKTPDSLNSFKKKLLNI